MRSLTYCLMMTSVRVSVHSALYTVEMLRGRGGWVVGVGGLSLIGQTGCKQAGVGRGQSSIKLQDCPPVHIFPPARPPARLLARPPARPRRRTIASHPKRTHLPL